MSYILCLETSTTNCSVALTQDGELIALKEDKAQNYSHAERLHAYIDEVLAFAKVEKSQLSAVAVSKGPGSYTGLRIGVSAAKGLCFALDIPLIAVATLESLAHKIKAQKDELVVPLLDARRMEVYSAIFDASGTQLRETKAEILNEESFSKVLEKQKVHFVGNGVAKFQEISTAKNAIFHPKELPSAEQLCTIAHQKFNENDFEDIAYFEPYYLKDFIAGKPKAK